MWRVIHQCNRMLKYNINIVMMPYNMIRGYKFSEESAVSFVTEDYEITYFHGG
jgi:hypothetical protein